MTKKADIPPAQKRPGPGRPPIDGHKPIPSQVVGIKQCASIIGVPVPLVTKAKDDGCEAFMANNRINTAVLVRWLFAMILSGKEIDMQRPQDRLADIRGKREAIKLEVDKKAVMPIQVAKEEAAVAMQEVFTQLERRDRELPPALAGCKAVEIGKIMTADTEKIRSVLSGRFNAIGNGEYKMRKNHAI